MMMINRADGTWCLSLTQCQVESESLVVTPLPPSLMFSDTPSPPLSLSITPTQSWTQDSTIDVDDAQHQTQTQSDAPGSSTVFEKKWIVTEVGDGGTSFSFVGVAHRLLKDPPPSSKSGECCFPTRHCARGVSISPYLTDHTPSFFRMVSRRTASFLTLTLIPVRRRRQREVRIVRAGVAPELRTLTHNVSL